MGYYFERNRQGKIDFDLDIFGMPKMLSSQMIPKNITFVRKSKIIRTTKELSTVLNSMQRNLRGKGVTII